MELLDAIETQPLTKIKQIIKSKNTSLGNSSLSSQVLMKAFAYERKDVISFLLENHCHVNVAIKTYSFTTTPLHCAIKLRDISLIKEILQKRPSVVNGDSDGNSSLHLAFLYKYEEAVDLILMYIEQTSGYTNAKNRYGLTHMHIACTRSNTNVIKGFLNARVNLEDFVNYNSPSWAGYTAMHFASDFGSLEAFKILKNVTVAKHRENSNTKMPQQLVWEHLQDLLVMSYFFKDKNQDEIRESESYIILACLREDPSLLRKFIDLGANMDTGNFRYSMLNPSRNSPLHFAVERNRKVTVELLLQHDADVKYKNCYSMTALHLALYEEDCSEKNTIVDLLYKAHEKIESNIEDENGLGYFQIAVTRNDLEVVKELLKKSVDVNKLIKPNLKGFSHFTPLHFAVLYQHTEMVELLIKHGADVDLTGEKNDCGTPLHMAFETGQKDLIEVLLSRGADAKLVRAFDGKTMLHSLVSNFITREGDNLQQNILSSDKQAILMYVEQLIKLGVEVNTQDEYGGTALHVLELHKEKCAPCFQLLLELGADINLENPIRYLNLPFCAARYDSNRCDSAEYLIFYHHVQKLKTLGLNVHPDNDKVCEMILRDLKKLEPNGKGFRTEDLACRQQQRLDEVAKLKNIMITSFMSLHNFLKLEPRRAAAYMPNDVLEEILEHKDFDKTYPSYGYLIRLQYKRNSNCSCAKDSGKRTFCSTTDENSLSSKRQRLE